MSHFLFEETEKNKIGALVSPIAQFSKYIDICENCKTKVERCVIEYFTEGIKCPYCGKDPQGKSREISELKEKLAKLEEKDEG